MFDTKKILQLYRCHEKSYEVGRELNTLINQKKSNFNLKDASARRINEQTGKKCILQVGFFIPILMNH